MVWLLALWLGCGGAEPELGPACEDGARLFGAPDSRTGLDAEQCAPVCEDCPGGAWSPPAYGAESVAKLKGYVLAAPLPELVVDPYGGALPEAAGAEAVCAVRFGAGGSYGLEDYADAELAVAAGAEVTHSGSCGLCSTLEDLAVYMARPDLTEPVRACGLQNALAGHEALVGCLEELGFTLPCAQIWAFNTDHTRQECGATCIALLDAQWHTADGALNDCLQCDEDRSGAVFKAIAGRTRRNTGLASNMCRPCSEVVPIEHGYALP